MENTIIFDKNYFIKKFEAISSNEIGDQGLLSKCALWYCGIRIEHKGWRYVQTPESEALIKLFGGKVNEEESESHVVWMINDASFVTNTTPKERILNRLKSLPD